MTRLEVCSHATTNQVHYCGIGNPYMFVIQGSIILGFMSIYPMFTKPMIIWVTNPFRVLYMWLETKIVLK